MSYSSEARQKAEMMIRAAEALMFRRRRLCSLAPRCPHCRVTNVQLVESAPLARWKCRACKHRWTYEPIIMEKRNAISSDRQDVVLD